MLDTFTFTLEHQKHGSKTITIDSHNMYLLEGYDWKLYGLVKGRTPSTSVVKGPGALIVKCATKKVLLARLILNVSNLINIRYLDNNPLNLIEDNLVPAAFAQYNLEGTKRVLCST